MASLRTNSSLKRAGGQKGLSIASATLVFVVCLVVSVGLLLSTTSIHIRGGRRARQECRRDSDSRVVAVAELTRTVRAAGGRGEKYLKAVAERSIDGWFMHGSLLFYAAISKLQHNALVRGSVGEIGVHHGLGFLAAVLSSDSIEPLFACDVFNKQELNVDGSGKGSLDAFSANLAVFELKVSDVVLYKGQSTDLTPSSFPSMGLPRFRFFSIDGGHTKSITIADLSLVACYLAPGGVIALVSTYRVPIEMPWSLCLSQIRVVAYPRSTSNRTILPMMNGLACETRLLSF